MRGKGLHVYKYVWDPSHKLFNHLWMSFRGMPNFLSSLVSNRPDICGLLTISRYMWCYLDVLLVFLRLAIPFEWALFLGLPIGHLTVFSLSVDLKEAAMYYITWLK